MIAKIANDPIPIWQEADSAIKAYLFWQSALRLKLGTLALEPTVAVPSGQEMRSLAEWVSRTGRLPQRFPIPGHWREPAHWFDPGHLIAAEEAIVLTAIDTVYQDLHLIQHIGSFRQISAGLDPSRIGAMPEPIPGPDIGNRMG